MPLTPHTNWVHGSYANDLEAFIKNRENPWLAQGNTRYLHPYYDGSIAIGYGFDVLVRTPTVVQNYITAANVGGTITQTGINLLNAYHAALAAGNVTTQYLQTLATNLYDEITLPNEPAATNLFWNVTNALFEPAISITDLPESKEKRWTPKFGPCVKVDCHTLTKEEHP